MDKLLLDTNFLLDVALEMRPDSSFATQLTQMVVKGSVTCLVTVCSMKDFYYISRSDISEDIKRQWLEFFSEIFYIPDTGSCVAKCAISSNEPDFEDGIIRAVAELEKVDYIITRDKDAYLNSSVCKTSAKEYLRMLRRDE